MWKSISSYLIVSFVPNLASNGAAASHIQVPDIQKRDAKENGAAETKVPHSRVFLLGENRWEDSSRLIGRNKQDGGSSINKDATRCISCRGEGRLLCSGALHLFELISGIDKYLKDVTMS